MACCPVSVIIPTYNRALFLGRAIDSVMRQTLPCAEIIVIDDGSTDETESLLYEMKKDSRVPFITVKTENLGVAGARNLGLRQVRFDFVAFLDSDDHWHKRKLENQYSALSAQDEYLISHTFEKWYRRGEHLNQKKKHIPRQGDIFDHCLELCAVGMSTVMARRDLFDNVGCFDESMRCCEDYDLWLRVSHKHEFLLIDKPLTIKEGGREDQLSFIHRVGMDERRIYSIMKFLDTSLPGPSHRRRAIQELERKIDIFTTGCIKHKRFGLAEKYVALLKNYQREQKENNNRVHL